MQKEISINNIDCTDLFTRYGYSVTYKKIRGKAGGSMLDGSTVEDVLAIKAVVTLPLMPLTENQLHELLNNIYGDTYVILRYFDVRTNEYEEKEFIYPDFQISHVFANIYDNEMWKMPQISLTER